MPHFIYILELTNTYKNTGNWTAETNAILEEHWNHLMQMHSKGEVVLVGRTNLPLDHPDNHGYNIFEADSLEQAQQILESDPTIAKGVMTGKVFPFNLALLKGEQVVSQ
ncbi:MAG: YciI family protein [Chitinophagales bacterium]